MKKKHTICDVILVVRAVEVLSVPACWEEDVGADSTLAGGARELLSVELTISAGCCNVASEVWSSVAPVAVLHLHLGVWP